ncbi:tetratricopeptide repeat protein [Myxococcota bacterium]|nr:tetratricopeptide repeat protein [Myxococcota bacterium]MBU1381539.1 tetratricopeptide repeat protein [Myxococcota bacterium]MBU1497414.1 tetratricopeptide repeat protein [Myxococcota bacterium]
MDKKSLLDIINKNRDEKFDKYCFILGAGASVASGIPTGAELVKRWIPVIKDRYSEDDIRIWINETIPELDRNNFLNSMGLLEKGESDSKFNPAKYYSLVYKKRFEYVPDEGYTFLEKEMSGKNPSCGYAILAKILENETHNIVITTNFDSLTEDALFIYTNKKPLVIGHGSLAGYIRPDIKRPIIIKIHHDLLFNPRNTSDETAALDYSFKEGLRLIFKFYTPIVIGYGGNDGSLMNFLKEVELRSIYWLSRGEPDSEIIDLVNKKNGFVVKIPSFDEFFIESTKSFGVSIDEILNFLKESSAKREEVFKDQVEKTIRSSTGSPEIIEILKSVKDPYIYGLISYIEKDYNKKEAILIDGLSRFPDSGELMATYAKLLEDKNEDKAIELYDKALILQPNNGYIIGSYAIFLFRIGESPEKIEKLYERAIKLLPENKDFISSYATFLHHVKKDTNKADIFYKKALELSPNHAVSVANYANFLHHTGLEIEKAEHYYIKSINLEPNNSAFLGDYAGFLLYIKKDYEKVEEYFIRALKINPDDPINLGNYACFLQEIKKEFDKAEDYFCKAIRATKNNPVKTSVLCNYASFVIKVRKDIGKADKLYKECLDRYPLSVEYMIIYGDFLISDMKDYGKAKSIYEKALQVDPLNAKLLSNYAKLEIEIGEFMRAEELIEIAFKGNMGKKIKGELEIKLELWFFRYAIFFKKYPNAGENVKKLLDDGVRSNGKVFTGVVIKSEKLNHPDIVHVKKLAKLISEEEQFIK